MPRFTEYFYTSSFFICVPVNVLLKTYYLVECKTHLDLLIRLFSTDTYSFPAPVLN